MSKDLFEPKDIGRISYFDNDFPNGIRDNIKEVEEYIHIYLKYRSYCIYYNAYLNQVVFEFLFDYKTICVGLDYDFILNEDKENIWHSIRYLIEKEFRKIWLKEISNDN